MNLHSLYAKFLLGYLIFGLLGFIAISTFSSEMIYDYLLDRQYESLYSEANRIASQYSDRYRGADVDEAEATPLMEAAASFFHADIWVVNRQGTLILDTTEDARILRCGRLLFENQIGLLRLEELQLSLEDIFLKLTGKQVSL